MDAVEPNFFIVGAPKSGTTALYRYLRQHPLVFMPRRKEPHFFAPDLYAPRYVWDQQQYLALFEEGRGKPRIGEASVYYLYSKEAALRIRSFAPEAKIIIMLRNPVDMIYSLHSQRLFSGYEDIEQFEEALAAEEDRKTGRRIPRHGYPVACLFYTEIGKYGEQVRRYLDVFQRHQIHVILFDDFARDTPKEYRKVCRFLGIANGYEPQWQVHNRNKRIRSARLRSVMKFTPRIKRTVRTVLPYSVRAPIKKTLLRLNTQYGGRPPLSPETRRRLQAEFAADATELSELLGRDLSHWVDVRAGTGREAADPKDRTTDGMSPPARNVMSVRIRRCS